ncbi:AraC family transcriptional regulator [Anaerostipes sp.]|uniref:AraC family transcriptional regulator n=1 Tax=Anaerostipes sp. TaxID=1872530 RepID=UPI0025C59054|nr:AraC family transcriptional regulator [Anaerostipes sp.]MBS7009390.1 helix-turn-helix domain-containing protein [Anaerostipes sp.]
MFLEEFKGKERRPVFEKNQYPKISRLSHSYDNPTWNYQYHLHKNETELVYISKGKGTYFINTNSYQLKKGSILIVEQGAIHSLFSDKNDPLSCWTCAVTDYKLCGHPDHGFMLPANVCPFMQAGIHESCIHRLFEELNLMRQFTSDTSLSACDALAASLANIYYELFYTYPKAERQKNSSFARDVLIYINENYACQITLKKLARQFHISTDHISHEFSKTYGISPINYVIDRRLNEAKWMLINTSDSLVSIARKIGYENTNHFSNLFQKRMNYPPLKFRELFQHHASEEIETP